MSKYTDAVAHNCKGLEGVNPGSVTCCPECVQQFELEHMADIDAICKRLCLRMNLVFRGILVTLVAPR